MNAVDQVFGIPELLELIILHTLDSLDYLDGLGDARPQNTFQRAHQLTSTLTVAQVNRQFHEVFQNSIKLQRRLFLAPDHSTSRSWKAKPKHELPDVLQMFYICVLESSLPLMNPMIQVEFSNFPFRFWNLPYKTSGGKHCAFMIVTRDDMVRFQRMHLQDGCGTVVTRMYLSQPPCTALQCDIFEDRDETREYVGRTTSLEESLIAREDGLTIGYLYGRLSKIFDSHKDIARVKLMTV